MDNSIRKEVTSTSVTVDRVYTADFQKGGTKTAQLRQEVTTKAYYPSKQIKNDLQDNIFNLDDFGFGESVETNTEKRVAWIDVPAIIENTDDVTAKLPADSCLYKILSNHPILTSNQKYAIDEGLTTLEAFADRQVIRYPEGSAIAGQLIKDTNGKPQYRSIFFSASAKEDEDRRTLAADDFYASAIIQAQLTGVAAPVAGQSI